MTDKTASPGSGSTKRRGFGLTSLALTGGALVLEPTTGVLALLAKMSSLAADRVNSHETDKLWASVESVEERVRALEGSEIPTRRIREPALSILHATFEASANEYFGTIEDLAVMTECGIDPVAYREAAEELEELGLIILYRNGNSPSGIGRTRLDPAAFFSVAPTFRPHFAVPEVALEILEAVGESGWANASEVFHESSLSMPLFDLFVCALESQDLLEGRGTYSEECGSYSHLALTPVGRRVVRGDDPFSPGRAT